VRYDNGHRETAVTEARTLAEALRCPECGSENTQRVSLAIAFGSQRLTVQSKGGFVAGGGGGIGGGAMGSRAEGQAVSHLAESLQSPANVPVLPVTPGVRSAFGSALCLAVGALYGLDYVFLGFVMAGLWMPIGSWFDADAAARQGRTGVHQGGRLAGFVFSMGVGSHLMMVVPGDQMGFGLWFLMTLLLVALGLGYDVWLGGPTDRSTLEGRPDNEVPEGPLSAGATPAPLALHERATPSAEQDFLCLRCGHRFEPTLPQPPVIG
jgi:DNA-directed RNA polymerase subunit RPC12/RpoP